MKGWRGLVVPIAALILWEVVMRVNNMQSDSLAPPSEIAVAFVQALFDGTIARGTAQTLGSSVVGLVIGGGLAVLASVIMGLVPAVARLSQFSVEVLRPIPVIALLPIGILALGFGYSMEIALVAFACFWPVLIFGYSAIANIEPQLIDVSRVLRLNAFGRVTKIVLPAALPRYFVAFRLAAALALIIAVTVEIASNPLGIGHELMMASISLHPALMFALLLWIGLVGWGLNAGLLLAQKRLFGRAALVRDAQ
jgi:ABC-type nitrate/sulfonate/bicarbonate transport system permease component